MSRPNVGNQVIGPPFPQTSSPFFFPVSRFVWVCMRVYRYACVCAFRDRSPFLFDKVSISCISPFGGLFSFQIDFKCWQALVSLIVLNKHSFIWWTLICKSFARCCELNRFSYIWKTCTAQRANCNTGETWRKVSCVDSLLMVYTIPVVFILQYYCWILMHGYVDQIQNSFCRENLSFQTGLLLPFWL